MSTNSNVANEIDAIIASAMAEYQRARGINVFEENNAAQAMPAAPEPESEDTTPDIIPTNSSSILVEETTSRFSSAIWFDNIKTKHITIAGLGGIGSYVTFLLARMQPETLYLYDNDIVEAGNMSGQLYSSNNIGRPKVTEICSCIENYANYYNALCYNERFTRQSIATDIMICGFDSMEARKDFFEVWKAHVAAKPKEEQGKCLFIDGRLAAENFQVFCIKGDDERNKTIYENDYLFSDYEADETVCSYKQTTFMANMIGSIMVNLFVNFCANECDPLVPRDLPFYTEYTAETMYFKVVA